MAPRTKPAAVPTTVVMKGKAGRPVQENELATGKAKRSKKTVVMAERPAQPRKRKASPNSEDDEEDGQRTKVAKKAHSKPEMEKAGARAATAPKAAQTKQQARTLNSPPTQALDVYVFGEGSAGELGLGAGDPDDVMNVLRPRLNPRLDAKSVGVVHVAVGGMHCAALTHENKILTWGVNDQAALGRPTDEGLLVDIDEEGDSGLNPSEAEPREVDPRHFPKDTTFAQLIAADSATFALTTTGRVYGWGTFRGNDGILGFQYKGPSVQSFPILIPELKNITSLAAGTNHILALDSKGKVFIWGAGEQNQLGRRIIARTATGALVPRELRFRGKRIVHIGCGDYHSYAVDSSGAVLAWGLNSFAQCGSNPGSGDSSSVMTPTVIDHLRGFEIQQITGGAHHALALTTDGKVLVWGRADNKQAGVDLSLLPAESCIRGDNGKIYLTKPVIVPNLDCVHVSTASDTCAAITRDGKAYTWGFNENHQAGQGKVEEVPLAQLVNNTAVRGKKLVFAGVGGQFGIMAGIPVDN